MIEKLLKAGADANAAVHRRRDGADDGARDRATSRRRRCCSTHGATVDAREKWRGQTALMWAAAQGHPDDDPRARRARRRRQRAIGRRRSGNGRSRPSRAKSGCRRAASRRCLFAARQGCVECVPVLASLGADVNATDQDGISPLVIGA